MIRDKSAVAETLITACARARIKIVCRQSNDKRPPLKRVTAGNELGVSTSRVTK